MPFFKTTQLTPQYTKLLDVKSQKCGLRHTFFETNGDEYNGEWQNNKKHGIGTQIWKKSGTFYNGEWKFGKRDGYGRYSVLVPKTKNYELKYAGKWTNGKKHGYGTYFYNKSTVYEGDWSEDNRSGSGKIHYENGDIYEGEWTRDKCHGQGIIQHVNGNSYEGLWKDGKKNGNGKFYYLDKGQIYEGFWVDGVAKCGTLSYVGKDDAPIPIKHPIPKVELVDMELVLRKTQAAHLDQRIKEERKKRGKD
ncbi:MORN repeat-containing protein 3-like [Platichthys flesus]|uniref:MORN repeat-containing protein 3-like n=1 Tax=Platichthys flesus TaxID=8260 RepID=UPI002DB86FFE|nr:MORN repeat-containing protein 3-like [Platichthys flesus]